jgi:hypothetical protein
MATTFKFALIILGQFKGDKRDDWKRCRIRKPEFKPLASIVLWMSIPKCGESVGMYVHLLLPFELISSA